jgi:PKD repeat protein
MKKILLPLFFLFVSSVNLYAIFPTPAINQTKYRWRNDNGSETTATWKAAENTAITLADTVSILRARIELQDNSGASYDIDESLEYSSNGGTTWTTITNAPTNAFIYQSSANVTDGGATTNQISTGTAGTFVAGRIISAVPSATPMVISSGEKTEFEWVIKPTGNLLPMTTYTFRSAGQGSTPLNYPTITTTCVNVSVVSKTDSSICGPGIVGLKAIGSPGTTIKWYDVPSGGTALGTGTNFTTPFLTVTKIYYAAAALGATCESPRVAVTAKINPIPVVNLGSDITVCQGDPGTFNAGNFNAYLWDNGATTQTRTVTAAGTYYVTVTGIGNCKGSDTVKLLNNPKPVVNLGNDTMICPGTSLTLNAGNPGMEYIWDDGSTAQTRTVNTAGTYSVTVTNGFDCSNTDMISVIIKDIPLGNINAVHGNPATYTFDVLNPQYAVGYLWDFGDGSPVESGLMRQHTYTANGIYTVKLTLVGDCGNNAVKQRTVDVFDANATGIGNINDNDAVVLYPNPAKESVVIENKTDLTFKTVEVFNILGQKITINPVMSSSKITLNTAGFANGIYSLRIETDKGFFIRKFEIRK